MGFINISGTDLYYQSMRGREDRATLLYIHGSGASHEVWSNQMNLDFHSIALDLPGHGRSKGNAADSISQSAQNIAEFLGLLQNQPPVYLAGHSMGAAIAITCAINYPELINGIVLIGAGQRMKVMPAFLDDLLQGRNDPDFIRMGFSPQAPAAMVDNMVKIFAEVPTPVLYADFSACNNFDVSGELEKIVLPVLIIAGSDDRLTPFKLAQYMADHINNCRLEVISGAGHFAMLEKPEAVNRLITEFCS